MEKKVHTYSLVLSESRSDHLINFIENQESKSGALKSALQLVYDLYHEPYYALNRLLTSIYDEIVEETMYYARYDKLLFNEVYKEYNVDYTFDDFKESYEYDQFFEHFCYIFTNADETMKEAIEHFEEELYNCFVNIYRYGD